MRSLRLVSLLAFALTGACTTFGSVRSAEVVPGASLALQATLATPPGEGPAWFWSFDCATECDRFIPSPEAGITLGTAAGRTPVSLGAGISGMYPFVEGYVQLNGAGQNPWGVGTRVGVPVTGWNEHQLFARFDRPLADGKRLLLSPGIFVHTGRSPNRENTGSMVALTQGVGLMYPRQSYTLIPSLSLVVGRGERDFLFGSQRGDFTTVFGTASIGVVVGGRRAPK